MSEQNREILYTLRDDAGQVAQRFKIVIGPLTMLDSARYQVHLREGREWADGPEPEKWANGDPMLIQRRLLGLYRAQMLAATKRIEAPEGEEGEDESAWKECGLPEEWRTVAGFVEGVPARLYTVWHEVAIDCNPGLFAPDMGDEAKNAVSVSVLS